MRTAHKQHLNVFDQCRCRCFKLNSPISTGPMLLNMQAVARKFNQLQRREASKLGGTQSLIDLKTTTKTARGSSRRPRSSGGRMTVTQTPPSTNSACQGTAAAAARMQIALPCLAGATLQRKDGGGFTAVRQPPLRASKGLPSSTQVNEGFARKRAKERKLASNTTTTNSANRGGSNATDLGAGVKEEFAVQVARRDDILQVCTCLN